jgi:hypothetical protein
MQYKEIQTTVQRVPSTHKRHRSGEIGVDLELLCTSSRCKGLASRADWLFQRPVFTLKCTVVILPLHSTKPHPRPSKVSRRTRATTSSTTDRNLPISKPIDRVSVHNPHNPHNPFEKRGRPGPRRIKVEWYCIMRHCTRYLVSSCRKGGIRTRLSVVSIASPDPLHHHHHHIVSILV